MPDSMKVYEAINAVQADLAEQGISKLRRNQQQGYSFRGIDDVYNALAPALAKHGLCMLPRILSRVCEERQSSKGGTLFFVTVEAEYDLVCAADGSRHTIRTYGEAMDAGDKATNKAMSAAYKYAAMQAFAIPTEGDNDADATTHEVSPRAQAAHPRPDMDAILKSIGGSVDLKTLKGHATAAWNMLADKADRARIKDAYDQREAELIAPEAGNDN
jgi:hypothetical protein